jgi:hypothetical protein
VLRLQHSSSPDWLKFKNPNAPAVKREAEEDWGKRDAQARHQAHRVLLHREQSVSRHHLSSTKKNIHAVPLHMAIMLAVNSAADKSSCPFGSLRLLDIISLSQLACVSNDEIWGPKPLARQDKAVRSCLPHPNFGRVFSLLVLQACECVFHTELSPFP